MRSARRHPLLPMLLIAIVLPLLLFLIFLRIADHTFQLLGLSRAGAFWLIGFSLVGGVINIPITRRRIELADPALRAMAPWMQALLRTVHYYPPLVTEQVLAINVGGCLVPVVFSVYLLTLRNTSVVAALGTMAIVAVVAFTLARPMPGMGITLPGFIPPIVAALAAHFLAQAVGMPQSAPPVAYIGGTLGTLIGADLLNLPRVLNGALLANTDSPNRTHIASIGGAGVYDGIFLTGIIAPFLA